LSGSVASLTIFRADSSTRLLFAISFDVAATNHRDPAALRSMAVSPLCSLDSYESRDGRFACALKNSQLTWGDIIIVGEPENYFPYYCSHFCVSFEYGKP
jgi:hypothetical protein